jgi:hypothetical protein
MHSLSFKRMKEDMDMARFTFQERRDEEGKAEIRMKD